MHGYTFIVLMLLSVSTIFAGGQAENQVVSTSFSSMSAPQTIEDMIKTYTSSVVKLVYADKSEKSFKLEYKQLFKSDKTFDLKDSLKNLVPAGSPLNAKGEIIIDNSVASSPIPFISDAPDSNSLLKINGKLYLVSHYEYDTLNNAGLSAYGKVPASISVAELNQDAQGMLSVKSLKKADFSQYYGLWIPCNGSASPWGTHIGSEEYEPDARWFESEMADPTKDSTNVKSFVKLYEGSDVNANPYHYGWTPEVSIMDNGTIKAVKHYSMGRFSKELAVMASDNKTAYFGDDGSYTTLFMYVADNQKDLSSGTLYAAKVSKDKLTWIKLGHATDAEIAKYLTSKIKFSDIFETSATMADGFTAIKQYSFAAHDKVGIEYLKVKAGMEQAAAFLESRRYAAILGACSEWNKMEGVAVDSANKKLFVAISDQSKGMEANPSDPVDQIATPKISSGAVFEFTLEKGAFSDFQPASFKTLISGEDLKVADTFGNRANVDKIANPDNLSFSSKLKTLFIGEDSGMHTNNFVWAYSMETGTLSRILSVPAGAEATGLSFVEGIGNYSYITSNYQHPGDEIKDDARFPITAVSKAELLKALETGPSINSTGGVGYILGLPSLQ